MSEETERITKKIREICGESNEPFRPFALYREPLDYILVLIRDCSFMEDRVDESLSLLEDMYPDDP